MSVKKEDIQPNVGSFSGWKGPTPDNVYLAKFSKYFLYDPLHSPLAIIKSLSRHENQFGSQCKFLGRYHCIPTTEQYTTLYDVIYPNNSSDSVSYYWQNKIFSVKKIKTILLLFNSVKMGPLDILKCNQLVTPFILYVVKYICVVSVWFVLQKWRNEFVSWDPEQCGSSQITIPRKLLWVPDVVINEL